MAGMTEGQVRQRVIVLGGGFGGLQTAIGLANMPVDVTLIAGRHRAADPNGCAQP